MNNLYNMIFKRKSFRRFNNTLSLSEDELHDINKKTENLIPLVNGIDIKYKIVPREETTCKRGEYCLLIYSDKEQHYLLNVGYIFEQLDLYLASKNIGVCWYGMGKVKESTYKNLDYVIMLAIGKGSESEFRKDYRKSKRKYLSQRTLLNVLAVTKIQFITHMINIIFIDFQIIYLIDNIKKQAILSTITSPVF